VEVILEIPIFLFHTEQNGKREVAASNIGELQEKTQQWNPQEKELEFFSLDHKIG